MTRSCNMRKDYVSPNLDALLLSAVNMFAASDTIETFLDPEDFEDSEDPNNP